MFLGRVAYLVLACFCFTTCQGVINSTHLRIPDEPPSHWVRLALRDLHRATNLYSSIKNYRAKNAILFLGDGMGMTSVTTGRILKGQLEGQSGEEATLEFEQFPHTGLAKTYNTDKQTPDSAGTATAFLCGVKARSGTMGVNSQVETRNCSTQVKNNFVYSFLSDAQEQGKSVGIVTTTRITHATPGAAYAHVVWRDWESDTDRNKYLTRHADRRACADIAQQLVENAINFTVLFGGGRTNFLPKSVTTLDQATNTYVNGRRSDSVNLVHRWQAHQRLLGRHAKYLETRRELLNVTPGDADVYLGLFAPSHLNFVLDNTGNREPSLEEMTQKAIQILQRNPNGFALLVEGGRIDHGHHQNQAKKAMHELVEFDKAIQLAGSLTSPTDTLTVVTADHSHMFSIGGWANRGQPVFGKVDGNTEAPRDGQGNSLSEDGKPYTSLLYGDGPSAWVNGSRPDITNVNTEDAEYTQQAVVKHKVESHGSEDVPIYAVGPGAHLFHSTHEQSYVAHVIKYSLCIGPYAKLNICLNLKK